MTEHAGNPAAFPPLAGSIPRHLLINCPFFACQTSHHSEIITRSPAEDLSWRPHGQCGRKPADYHLPFCPGMARWFYPFGNQCGSVAYCPCPYPRRWIRFHVHPSRHYQSRVWFLPRGVFGESDCAGKEIPRPCTDWKVTILFACSPPTEVGKITAIVFLRLSSICLD